MARYKLLRAAYGTPNGAVPQMVAAGRTIADSALNAIGTDVVWPEICTGGRANPNLLSPLDAAASTVMGLPIGTNQVGVFSGADSVQP